MQAVRISAAAKLFFKLKINKSEVQTNMEYLGKYIIENDKDDYMIRLSKKHLIYLNLLFEFVDNDLIEQTKDLKYFYHEIKQELNDILNPVNDLYND